MRRRQLFAAAFAAALSHSAVAHSPMEGIGEFYGGILHPLLVLPHALSLVVLGLLVGQGGVRAMRFTYPPFIVALAAGLFVTGFQLQTSLPLEKMLLLLAMVCGLLVALQSKLPAAFMAMLGTVLAFLIGMDSGVSGLSRRETFAALCGCWLGAVLLLIMVAGIAEMAERSWQRVALRVLGSWTAASGALVLALAMRPGI